MLHTHSHFQCSRTILAIRVKVFFSVSSALCISYILKIVDSLVTRQTIDNKFESILHFFCFSNKLLLFDFLFNRYACLRCDNCALILWFFRRCCHRHIHIHTPTVMAYMEMFGNCSHTTHNNSEFVRHSVHTCNLNHHSTSVDQFSTSTTAQQLNNRYISHSQTMR